MILGAVGTGKTSACMYPYVDQLLRWRAQDPAQKVGGLVLEVKGDFCHQVRGILRRAGREDDYLEIGLDTGVLLQPATQRSGPLRRRVRDCQPAEQSVRTRQGTVLAAGVHGSPEVRHLAAADHRRIHDAVGGLPFHHQRRAHRPEHPRAEGAVPRPARSVWPYPTRDYEMQVRQSAVDTLESRWDRHRWRIRTAPNSKAISSLTTFRSRCAKGTRGDLRGPPASARSHRSVVPRSLDEARWKVKASIVEGVVVFLSLFDENPAVFRAFCPPRSAYANPPQPGNRAHCRPLDDLLEEGQRPRAEFPRGFESRVGARSGSHAQARFPARRAQPHPEDLGQPAGRMARHSLCRRRIPRLCDGGRNRSDRRRARLRAVAPGTADSDRGDAEHQLLAIGIGRR